MNKENKNKFPCGHDHGDIPKYEDVLLKVIANKNTIINFKNIPHHPINLGYSELFKKDITKITYRYRAGIGLSTFIEDDAEPMPFEGGK